MERTKERAFLGALSGIMRCCARWIVEAWENGSLYSEGGIMVYRTPFEGRLQDEVTAMADRLGGLCPLGDVLEEIEGNLEQANTERGEVYLRSILAPFRVWADIINPIAEIARIEKEIKGLEQQLLRLRQSGDKWQAQAAATARLIKKRRGDINQLLYRRDAFFWAILNEDGARWCEKGTIEHLVAELYKLIDEYGQRLDALLLSMGYDMERLQKESGVHLIDRDRQCLEGYLGTPELVSLYLSRCPQPEGGQDSTAPDEHTTTAPEMPKELTTARGQAILSKAVEDGLLKMEGGRYVWKGTHALYGYFVDRVTDALDMRPENDRIPWASFRFVMNHVAIVDTARRAVSMYTHGAPPPEGDMIIDAIIKNCPQ